MRNLILAFALLTYTFTYSQTWDEIGFSAVSSASEIDIEISSNGTLYRAYKNSSSIRVQQWSGTAWSNVGSTFGDASCFDIQLEIIGNDTPVVGYKTLLSSTEILAVRKWSGTTWQGTSSPTQGGYYITNHNYDFDIHANTDWDLFITYYEDYTEHEFITCSYSGNSASQMGGFYDDGNNGNAVGMLADEDGNTWVALEQNDIGDYVEFNKYNGSSWSNLSNVENNNSVVEMVVKKPGNALGICYIEETSGSNEAIRFRGFNIYSEVYGTSIQLTSGSAITEMDMDGEGNDMYVFYKSGSNNYIRRVSNILAPSNTLLYTNPAPANSTNLNIERRNGLMVISYILGGTAYVEELNNPATIIDWADFEMCEMSDFYGDEFGLLVEDNNYDHPDITVSIASQNTSIVPNSQINSYLMSQSGTSLYYTYNVLSTNGVVSTTIVDLDWEVEEYGSVVAAQTTGLTVFNSPAITFNLNSTDFCSNDTPINLNGKAFPLNGNWAGPGIFNNIFSPAQLPAGGHYLKYRTTSTTTGCIGIDSVLININPTPQLNVTTNDADCNSNDGNAFVTITSGSSPFTTYWSNGDTGTSATDLSPGQYFVYVSDNNGCIAQAPAMIATNGLDVTGSVTSTTCYGGNDGAIDVTVNGSNSPFTYYWNNGIINQDIANVPAGPYEVTVTDASNCISTATFTIPEPAAVTFSPIVTKSSCAGSTGSIDLNITSGNSPLTFSWTNGLGATVGGNSATLTNQPAGQYNCTITDANGCQYFYNGVITDLNSPNIATESITPSSCANDGEIDITIFPSTNIASTEWSNGQTSEDITGLLPGYYSVEVTNNSGCVGVAGFNVDYADPTEVQICLVTVDTNTITNKVVWEKPVSTTISHFNIYRETSQAGLYQIVDSVLYSEDSEFTDYIASPVIRSWRYKISSVDLCGNESNLSDYHKTIHLVINAGLGGTFNIAWDNYEGFAFSEFELWRKTDITPWENIQNMPTTLFTYTDNQVPTTNGLDYFLAISSPGICSSTSLNKAQDYNSSRSNKAEGLAGPTTNSIDESLLEFNLYPNPSTGILNFVWENTEALNYQVVDMSGKLVAQGYISTNSSINLSSLETGIYQFITQFNGKTNVQKIVIR